MSGVPRKAAKAVDRGADAVTRKILASGYTAFILLAIFIAGMWTQSVCSGVAERDERPVTCAVTPSE